MTLPSNIAKAIADHAKHGAVPVSDSASVLATGSVAAGDIRLINWQGHDQYRHVLVVDVDSKGSACEVLLLHSDVELATEFDIVLNRSETNAPYVLVAQTDVRGLVWTFDLESAVGRVSHATDRFSLTHPPHPSDSELRGVALAGPLDIRWQFKRREGEILAEISESCTADQLLGNQIYSVTFETLQWLLERDHHEFEIGRNHVTELLLSKQLIISPIQGEAYVLQTLSSNAWLLKDSDCGHDFLKVLLDQLDRDLMNDAWSESKNSAIEISREELIAV